MDQQVLKKLLQDVQDGGLSIDQALDKLTILPFEDLGFARVDHHRPLRCGFPEVIYCPGKTSQQVAQIVQKLLEGGGNILATRAEQETYQAVKQVTSEAVYDSVARTITIRQQLSQQSKGCIGIVCAGTSDLPVAQEALATATIMDQRVETLYDVGVAGLHRLLGQWDMLRAMNVLIVVAGMEGALPSVIGGLVSAPIIAVPTSVGYGANFSGLAALLTMLNSCAAGISVVNIDSGFAAGYSASLINRLAESKAEDNGA